MLGLTTFAGCASESLKPSRDGGAPDQVIHDPAACGCQVSGYTLTISWDCFCQHYQCTNTPQASCTAGFGQWTQGCNYQMYSISTIGGIERWAYDDTGQLVGAQLGSDTGAFSCPTDPSVQGNALKAGYLLEDCEAAVTTQYDPDTGTCLPTDAGLTF
jgi:hypothetical protein